MRDLQSCQPKQRTQGKRARGKGRRGAAEDAAEEAAWNRTQLKAYGSLISGYCNVQVSRAWVSSMCCVGPELVKVGQDGAKKPVEVGQTGLRE